MRKINYLIISLIALWACQSELQKNEKYARFQQTLGEFLPEMQLIQRKALSDLTKQVMIEGNTAEGKERIARAKLANQMTDSLNFIIEAAKSKILKTQSADLNDLLLGSKKNGLAYQIQVKINQYVAWLRKENADLGLTEEDLPDIALNNPQIELYKKTNYQALDFAEANFKNVSLTQVIIQIEQLQILIYQYNQEVLKKLGAFYDGGIGLRFERFGPMATAESNSVLAGEEYRAWVCMIGNMGRNPYHYFELFFADSLINYNVERQKLIQFTAQGQGEQTWQAKLKYKHPQTEADCTIIITQKYYVLPK